MNQSDILRFPFAEERLHFLQNQMVDDSKAESASQYIEKGNHNTSSITSFIVAFSIFVIMSFIICLVTALYSSPRMHQFMKYVSGVVLRRKHDLWSKKRGRYSQVENEEAGDWEKGGEKGREKGGDAMEYDCENTFVGVTVPLMHKVTVI